MANEPKGWNGTLPAPHQCVTIRISRWSDWSIEVAYQGTRGQLRAAGVVDDLMENKIVNQRAGRMLNSDGIRYHLLDRTQPKRVVWSSGGTLGLSFGADKYSMLKLPGVRELFPCGIPTDEGNSEAFAWCPLASTDRYSHRAIGRYQRLVEWASGGNVIWPNWRRITAEVQVASRA